MDTVFFFIWLFSVPFIFIYAVLFIFSLIKNDSTKTKKYNKLLIASIVVMIISFIVSFSTFDK
ncbi:hypothetical protein [Bacillus ndiopicus]|uniref:hypothetical protein n=1 Tax=Bacillus ndiopicus TaxID=1347368 RepID=UPI0005A966A1|nr:hypothetical protein [Bacillus ndiopicus]